MNNTTDQEVAYDQGRRAGEDIILSEIDNILENVDTMEAKDIIKELKAIKRIYGRKY